MKGFNYHEIAQNAKHLNRQNTADFSVRYSSFSIRYFFPFVFRLKHDPDTFCEIHFLSISLLVCSKKEYSQTGLKYTEISIEIVFATTIHNTPLNFSWLSLSYFLSSVQCNMNMNHKMNTGWIGNKHATPEPKWIPLSSPATDTSVLPVTQQGKR